jgi:toxin ParE1/3/4
MSHPDLDLVWSPEAAADLLQIWHYGARHFSSDQADAHLRDIQNSAASLQRHPHLGRPRDEFVAGIRSIVVYPTCIFYRVGKSAIEIVRVVDGRRNLAAIFSRPPND